MNRALVLPSALFTVACLSACESMKGVEVGGVKLDPFISAGEKIAKSGDVKENDEVELGSHMAGTLLGAAPLLKKTDVQRYVNRIGTYIASFSSRPNLPWRFGVLDDAGYNAFAAPGGYIFVTRGLLDELQSEAELAGILAHEITHVIKKHHLKAVQKSNRLGAATDVLTYFGEQQLQGSNHAELKAELAQKLVNISKELYARGLDKDDELEADRHAMMIAALSGYDPYAFVAVLQRLDQRNSDDTAFALMFKTHPKPLERIKALDETYSHGFSGSKYATLEARYKKETSK